MNSTNLKGTTILVVEDNPDHVGLIEAVISRGLKGAQVKVALLCEGARTYLRGDWSEYDDDAQHNPLPDLIVLDLWLPDGTGLELLEWISGRAWLKDIPVIMFTASTKPEHALQAKELGVHRYLQKPAHFGSLVAAIKEGLAWKSGQDVPDSKSNSAGQ